jgi:hypothetical protein
MFTKCPLNAVFFCVENSGDALSLAPAFCIKRCFKYAQPRDSRMSALLCLVCLETPPLSCYIDCNVIFIVRLSSCHSMYYTLVWLSTILLKRHEPTVCIIRLSDYRLSCWRDTSPQYVLYACLIIDYLVEETRAHSICYYAHAGPLIDCLVTTSGTKSVLALVFVVRLSCYGPSR